MPKGCEYNWKVSVGSLRRQKRFILTVEFNAKFIQVWRVLAPAFRGLNYNSPKTALARLFKRDIQGWTKLRRNNER